MQILPFLLQVIALVCLFLAMIGFPRFQWFPAGMFFWLLSLMVSGILLHPINH